MHPGTSPSGPAVVALFSYITHWLLAPFGSSHGPPPPSGIAAGRLQGEGRCKYITSHQVTVNWTLLWVLSVRPTERWDTWTTGCFSPVLLSFLFPPLVHLLTFYTLHKDSPAIAVNRWIGDTAGEVLRLIHTSVALQACTFYKALEKTKLWWIVVQSPGAFQSLVAMMSFLHALHMSNASTALCIVPEQYLTSPWKSAKPCSRYTHKELGWEARNLASTGNIWFPPYP